MPAPSSGSSRVRLLLVLALLAAATAGGWYYFKARQSAGSFPEFTTTTVTRGNILQNITATGQLDPLLSVDVGSQISGLIVKLNADFNTVVKKDQIIAEIDPATYQQRLRQAEADLASSEASHRLQALNTERTRELYAKNLVTKQELDQAEAQLSQANAQLLTRRASVENANVDLARCTIRSPIDGIVMAKQTEVGKTVAASLNAPTLFTIANDLSKMQITAAVAEADIGSVEAGQSVTFTVDAFPNRTFNGEVVQVRNAPKTTQNVVTYDTIINVDNRDLRLRPGMTANVSIVVARRDNILRVPNAALRLRLPEGFPVANAPAAAGAPAVASAAPTPAAASASAPATSTAPATTTAERPRRAEAEGTRRTGGGGGGGSGGGGGGGRRGGLALLGGADLNDEQRATLREIITEVGVDFRSGPPSPEQIAQIRKLMAERGLPVAEAARPGETTVTTRTVYLLRGTGPGATLEAATVKVGISDGSASEIISGVNAGDTLVTAVILPGAAGGPTAGRPPQNNPFGGGPRRGF